VPDEAKVEGTVTQPQPTVEEQVAKIREELKSRDEELDKTKKRMQGLEGSLKEKDKQLNDRAGIEGRLQNIEESNKIFATLFAQQGVTDIDDTQKKNILNQYQEMVKQNELKTKEAQRKAQLDEYSKKADAIYDRAKTVILNKKDLKTVELLLKNGDPEGAEEIINEQEIKVVEPKVDKENEEARINRLADEKFKSMLKEKGLDKVDTITPSGSVKSDYEAEAAYARSEISWDKLPDSVKKKHRGY